MVLEKTLIEQLEQISSKDHVLTDLEDRYVYSFEKIFMDQAYPMPDLVIKVFSPNQIEKITEIAQKEGITLIRRGETFSHSHESSSKTIILIDDVKIPTLKVTNKDIMEKPAFPEILYELRRVGHGTPRNLALAIHSLFLEKNLSSCNQCVKCSDYCTVTPSFNGIETWSARGRALLIRGVMNGELNLTNKIVDILYTCNKCGRCFAECFENLSFHKAITSMRNKIAEKNLIPEVFQSAVRNIKDYSNPSAIPSEQRLSWMNKVEKLNLPKKADNLYWVGCMTATRTSNVAKAFYNILKSTKTDFTLFGENEGCCGYISLAAGLWKDAKDISQKIIEEIETTGATKLITPCAGCYYTFTKLYHDILETSLPCEIIHSSQLIEKLVTTGDVTLKPLEASVTYHDPCSLGRHCNVYDPPRNILKAIPNLNFVEIPFNQNYSRCCGGGGGLWTYNHRVSMNSAFTRLKEDFSPMNVDILTTACPQCQINLNLTSKRKSIPLIVRDITEMVESVLE
ncbi:MAG: heterodisulfide reductase-related iron-sulfur binding cluster [Candidatus Hodarchaeales archaeon]|jgi:glycolate oxidase